METDRVESAVQWDPGQYERFGAERGRPFSDLLHRVGAVDPAYVVDLGAGPGTMTATLADRWPGATVDGVDVSAEMMAAARRLERPGRLRFVRADLRTWTPDRPIDVLVSNATLQWVPDHADLLPKFLGWLAPGGWLGFQVPGNFDSPSHRVLAELAADDRWAATVAAAGVERPASLEPAQYATRLLGRCAHVDAWETTYLQVLPGTDPVYEWITGTAARPVLQALPPEPRAVFADELRRRLRVAYPPGPAGTVLPYRRVFVVAQGSS